jgi:hypothetical protein
LAENNRRGSGFENLDGEDFPAARAVKSETFDTLQTLTSGGIKGA